MVKGSTTSTKWGRSQSRFTAVGEADDPKSGATVEERLAFRLHYVQEQVRREDGSKGFTAEELEAGAISICQGLDQS